MAKIISFISEKGGVGKTTAVYHCAGALQRFHEKRVLVVDADYQRGGLTCRLIPELLEGFRIGEIPNTNTLYHAYRHLYSGDNTLPHLTVLTTSDKLKSIKSNSYIFCA